MTTKPTILDKACWAACPYIDQWIGKAKPKLKTCKRCPQWEPADDGFAEKMKRACRGIAEQVVEPVLKAIEK